MGTMTKKDFIAIARIIDGVRREMEADDQINTRFILDNVSRRLADHCRTTNPLFDRFRFLAACGAEQ